MRRLVRKETDVLSLVVDALIDGYHFRCGECGQLYRDFVRLTEVVIEWEYNPAVDDEFPGCEYIESEVYA